MTRKTKKTLAILLSATVVFTSAAPDASAAASVKFNKTSATVTKDKSFTLKISKTNVKKINKKTWSSSNSSVASVSSSGKVKGKKAGSATIKCKVVFTKKGKKKTSTKTLTCHVTVKNKKTTPATAPTTAATTAPSAAPSASAAADVTAAPGTSAAPSASAAASAAPSASAAASASPSASADVSASPSASAEASASPSASAVPSAEASATPSAAASTEPTATPEPLITPIPASTPTPTPTATPTPAATDTTDEPDDTEYTVTVDTATNGKVTADMSTAKSGATVTLTVAPDTGYKLDKLTVTDASNGKVTATPDTADKTKYTFTMPAGDVTVSAAFVEDSADPDTPADPALLEGKSLTISGDWAKMSVDGEGKLSGEIPVAVAASEFTAYKDVLVGRTVTIEYTLDEDVKYNGCSSQITAGTVDLKLYYLQGTGLTSFEITDTIAEGLLSGGLKFGAAKATPAVISIEAAKTESLTEAVTLRKNEAWNGKDSGYYGMRLLTNAALIPYENVLTGAKLTINFTSEGNKNCAAIAGGDGQTAGSIIMDNETVLEVEDYNPTNYKTNWINAGDTKKEYTITADMAKKLLSGGLYFMIQGSEADVVTSVTLSPAD